MYTLLKNAEAKKVITSEALPLGLSLLIAEYLFKFGSFLLEGLAFLATWYLVSFLFWALFARFVSTDRKPHTRT